jgi:exoribonuclease R
LLEGQDRLAIVIEFHVAADGSAKTQDVYPAFVRNYSKMSYEVIGEWLDNTPQLQKRSRQYRSLRNKCAYSLKPRIVCGKFEDNRAHCSSKTIQATPVMDRSGNVTDLAVDARNGARDLIESFMVAANGQWQSSWSNATSFPFAVSDYSSQLATHRGDCRRVT